MNKIFYLSLENYKNPKTLKLLAFSSSPIGYYCLYFNFISSSATTLIINVSVTISYRSCMFRLIPPAVSLHIIVVKGESFPLDLISFYLKFTF